jgi:hypothetical protein
MIDKDPLFVMTKDRFGIWSTRILLTFALILAVLPFTPQVGERAEGFPTILSWMPTFMLRSMTLMYIVRVVLAASAILWLLHRFVPWTSWLVVISFTMLWSLRMENVTNGAHIFNVTNMLLIVHAMWYQFYGGSIVAAQRNPKSNSDQNYPRWVFFLSVFFLGWFHTLAGITKLMASGLDWGNGLSLQMWVHMFGWRASPFSQLILYDRTIAQILQTGSLIIELGSILCIMNRPLRYIVGILLCAFYLGVLCTFVDFGFHFNAILVAWFLLPFFERFNNLPIFPKKKKTT